MAPAAEESPSPQVFWNWKHSSNIHCQQGYFFLHNMFFKDDNELKEKSMEIFIHWTEWL